MASASDTESGSPRSDECHQSGLLASATGRFDDEQLFYLRSRGIPEEAARRLVVRGFFNEIIAKIAVPAVRERLTEAIERELAITESRTS